MRGALACYARSYIFWGARAKNTNIPRFDIPIKRGRFVYELVRARVRA